MTLPVLYTVRQVAQALQVDRSTVYRYISRGELRAIRTGRRVRIRAEELERYLQENEIETPQDAAVRARGRIVPIRARSARAEMEALADELGL